MLNWSNVDEISHFYDQKNAIEVATQEGTNINVDKKASESVTDQHSEIQEMLMKLPIFECKKFENRGCNARRNQ